MRKALLVFLIVLPACVFGGDDNPFDDGLGEPDGGRMVDPEPVVEPLPDTGVGRLAGFERTGAADGSRAVATFDDPVNVLILPTGDIVVADFNNNLLRLVTPKGNVTTLADSQQLGFSRPFGMALMPDGTLIVQTDRNVRGDQGPDNGAIWRVTASGSATLIVNDTGRLRGLVPLADGRLFATDYLNHYVGIFDPRSGTFAPLAGTKGATGAVDGTGAAARFFTPYDAVPLPNGNMLVADYDNHCLRQITPLGVVTTYAGTCGTPGYVEGPVATALFNRPQALAIDGAGVIYVTDTDNWVIRKIEADQVTTLAGDGMAGFLDGPSKSARFYGLEGLDVTANGLMLYVADGDRGRGEPYHYIRRLPLDALGDEPPPPEDDVILE